MSTVKWINGRLLVLPSTPYELGIEDTISAMMRGDKKKWLKWWARTERGRDNVSDLIDRGRRLDWPVPISGGARNFDAVDDIIARPGDDAGLDVADSDSLILQTLLKMDLAGAAKGVCGKKNGFSQANQAGYQLMWLGTEVVSFTVSDAVDEIDQADGAGAIVAGTWYAFTGVLNAVTATNDDAYLYREGTVNGPTNSTVLGSLDNIRPFTAGATSNPGNFLDGDLAYVRFWKKAGAAWTTNERLQRVEWRNQLYLPQDLYMELQWILWDAGTPTTAIDYTDNGFDGTYTGTTFVDDPKRVYVASDWPTKVHRSAEVAVVEPLQGRIAISQP